MMRKIIYALAFFAMCGRVLAESQDASPDLRIKSIEKDLAQLVGSAVLYSMNDKSFERSISCLLSMYIKPDVAIAGLKWDVAHALLRIMAADPVQFFDVASRQNAQALDRWRQSFDHAAVWPGNKCPKIDPMTVARGSIERLRLEQIDSEVLRKKVVTTLKQWPCRVVN